MSINFLGLKKNGSSALETRHVGGRPCSMKSELLQIFSHQMVRFPRLKRLKRVGMEWDIYGHPLESAGSCLYDQKIHRVYIWGGTGDWGQWERLEVQDTTIDIHLCKSVEIMFGYIDISVYCKYNHVPVT